MGNIVNEQNIKKNAIMEELRDEFMNKGLTQSLHFNNFTYEKSM